MNPLLHIFRRLPAAIATTVAFGVSAAPQELALEPYTPQAIDANAKFLAYAPTIAGRPDMKVCVVDTGVDLTTDAAAAVVDRQTVFPNGPVGDGGGVGLPKHGTYVAGVIASQADDRDSVGIWPRAKIVSVRVFADEDSGTTAANYILALERCRLAGAKVVNLSLSGLDTASATELSFLENKIADLRSVLGMDIVAGAGNSGAPVGYPAAFPEVFAVGASDAAGAFCSFSSRGSALDISTFGCGVELTYSTGGITHASGTSLSTPVVSGVLAALRYYRPDLAPDRAEQLLVDNASRGPVNAVASWNVNFPNPNPTPGANPTPTPTQPMQPTPTPTPVPVLAPLPAPAPAKTSPRLTAARPTVARDHRTIAVKGTVARGTTGKVTIKATAKIHGRTRTVTKRATIRNRRYAAHMKLPSAEWSTATVTVTFHGDATHRSARLSRRLTQRRSQT